jgi:thymidylate kinase
LRGLIIEGVTAVGKTAVLGLLQARLAVEWPACTKVLLSEHYTERVLEDRKASRTLTFQDALRHSGEIVSLLEQLNSWKARGKFLDKSGNAEILVLVERFFGSHVANLRLSLGENLPASTLQDAVSLYKKIAALGLRVVILTIEPALIPAAVADTLDRRNDAWRAYVSTLGDIDAVAAHYQDWQSSLLAFYARLEDRVPIEVERLSTSTLAYATISDALFASLQKS